MTEVRVIVDSSCSDDMKILVLPKHDAVIGQPKYRLKRFSVSSDTYLGGSGWQAAEAWVTPLAFESSANDCRLKLHSSQIACNEPYELCLSDDGNESTPIIFYWPAEAVYEEWPPSAANIEAPEPSGAGGTVPGWSALESKYKARQTVEPDAKVSSQNKKKEKGRPSFRLAVLIAAVSLLVAAISLALVVSSFLPLSRLQTSEKNSQPPPVVTETSPAPSPGPQVQQKPAAPVQESTTQPEADKPEPVRESKLMAPKSQPTSHESSVNLTKSSSMKPVPVKETPQAPTSKPVTVAALPATPPPPEVNVVAPLKRSAYAVKEVRCDILSDDLNARSLSKCVLAGADLRGVNMSGADLEYANLSSANLSGANLRGARLNGANLTGAHLVGAKLEKASLADVNFRSADLSHADLSNSDLKRADLRGANLMDVSWQGSSLSKAILNSAKNLDCVRLNQALSFSETSLADENVCR